MTRKVNFFKALMWKFFSPISLNLWVLIGKRSSLSDQKSYDDWAICADITNLIQNMTKTENWTSRRKKPGGLYSAFTLFSNQVDYILHSRRKKPGELYSAFKEKETRWIIFCIYIERNQVDYILHSNYQKHNSSGSWNHMYN